MAETWSPATGAAVVSGANRGLGLELCRQLQQGGWRVVALCRNTSPELQALVAAGPGTAGAAAPSSSSEPGSSAPSSSGSSLGSVTVIEGVDVGSDDCIALLQQKLADMQVALLICNAGILGVDSLAQLDTAAIRQQFEVNALGPLRVDRALAPNLRPAGASKVAILSSKMGSIAATRDGGKSGSAGYRMSKAAANMGGQLLALDLAAQQTPVVLLHPGAVVTDMYHNYWAAVGEAGRAPSAHGPVSVEQAAAGVLARLEELDMGGTGRFLQATTGKELPW